MSRHGWKKHYSKLPAYVRIDWKMRVRQNGDGQWYVQESHPGGIWRAVSSETYPSANAAMKAADDMQLIAHA